MTADNPPQDSLIQASVRLATYRGRFAPSPTGPLHAGSLVAALASWLDARAHGGAWLVRIEDLDPMREPEGAANQIIADLAAFDFISDEPIIYQSTRQAPYEAALNELKAQVAVFACTCSRKEVLEASGSRLAPYPGLCRRGPASANKPAAWRLRVSDEPIAFQDRSAGRFVQRLESEVGDFIVRRSDGLWAYQLAVVIDDAAQGITDIVRGADLLDNTPRQIALQRALALPTPRYLHVPIVTAADGQKLSKQTGAQALDTGQPLPALERAWQHLGFERIGADSLSAFYSVAVALWQTRWASPHG